MAKEEKTLSEQDRNRIEREARKIASDILGIAPNDILPDDTIIVGATKGAEYEHKYQREQQAELRKLFSDIVFETEHDGGISLSTFKKIKAIHNIDPKLP